MNYSAASIIKRKEIPIRIPFLNINSPFPAFPLSVSFELSCPMYVCQRDTRLECDSLKGICNNRDKRALHQVGNWQGGRKGGSASELKGNGWRMKGINAKRIKVDKGAALSQNMHSRKHFVKLFNGKHWKST